MRTVKNWRCIAFGLLFVITLLGVACSQEPTITPEDDEERLQNIEERLATMGETLDALSILLTPTKTPMPTSTPVPPTPTPMPTRPTSTPTPVPPEGLGTLSFETYEGCDTRYSLERNGESVGSGLISDDKLVATGLYDLTLFQPYGELIGAKIGNGWYGPVIKESIEIREGDETVLDFTEKLGTVLFAGYPDLDATLRFFVINPVDDNRVWGEINHIYCLAPGKYNVDYGASNFRIGDLDIDFEVNAGEHTLVDPGNWPRPLGLLTFATESGRAPYVTEFNFSFKEQLTAGQNIIPSGGERDGRPGLSYWMETGTYRIVITETILGLTFDNVEIDPGKETVLWLPGISN